jgi:hypothetical protein
VFWLVEIQPLTGLVFGGFGWGKGRSIMRKFNVALALFGVLAFSVFAAVSASAETTLLAEWLFNSAAVTALLPVETEGSIFLSTLVLGIKALVSRFSQ